MAITPEQKELARHRFNRAEETLKESIDALARQSVSLSINRAYYSVEEAAGAIESAKMMIEYMKTILEKLLEVNNR